MVLDTGLTALRAADVAQVMGDAGMTILIGLTVVFAVLILLTFIFWLFGKVLSGSRKEAAAKETPAPAPVIPAPAPAPIPAPAVQDGVSDEVVAVIAAAVASLAPEGTTYTLRNVRRVPREQGRHGRPVWAAAGLADNTRPF